jgi:two-component system nitrate/nitrite response regulator NarL
MPDSAPSRGPIRIVIVEDHALLRGALTKTLSAEPDFTIAGECATVDQALSLVAGNEVDVVLLDINLGSEQGGSFVSRAKAAGYVGKTLVVTAGVSDREAVWLLNRGCSGIFLKNEPLPSLVAQVRRVVSDDSKPDQASIRATLQQGGQGVRRPLTARESRVLRRVCEGSSNKEIAEHMGVSEHSVKSFVQQLFSKTGARSRAQLVAIAIEQYWDQLEHTD